MSKNAAPSKPNVRSHRYCEECGVVLLPPERPGIYLDKGRLEYLCDHCMGITN